MREEKLSFKRLNVEGLSLEELKEYIVKSGIELLDRLEENSSLFDKVGEFLHELDFSEVY